MVQYAKTPQRGDEERNAQIHKNLYQIKRKRCLRHKTGGSNDKHIGKPKQRHAREHYLLKRESG